MLVRDTWMGVVARTVFRPPNKVACNCILVDLDFPLASERSDSGGLTCSLGLLVWVSFALVDTDAKKKIEKMLNQIDFIKILLQKRNEF